MATSMNIELKFKLIIGLICVLIFLLAIGWIFSNNYKKNLAYPDLQSGGAINGRVIKLETERGFARITFHDKKQGTIYFARNNSYSPPDLSLFIKRGDVILKDQANDTVKVLRDNTYFIFVLGKELR